MREIKLTPETFRPMMQEMSLQSQMGLSDLSRKTGLNRNTLEAWITGRNGPGLYSLCQYLEAMGKELVIREKVSGDG